MIDPKNWPFDPADLVRFNALPERYKGMVDGGVRKAIEHAEFVYLQKLAEKDKRAKQHRGTTSLRLVK